MVTHAHTNHLIHETSPYLLQHAHNPVNWYPWGEEALQKAITEDKPILVSIGYAACHWCHVMERESFEDETTAALMNEHFINIKIDREERPDLDHIYMDAVQAMSGSGGWPLNVFLTPQTKPFYGGTYFPPQRAFNRPSWKEILTGVHQAYRDKKDDILLQAENLTNHLFTSNSFGLNKTNDADLFSDEQLQLIATNLLANADKEWGGFGKAPKFPQTFSIQYLLRHYHFTKDEASLKQALLSLDKMIGGGIYDQLGGGFARYSTDEQWLAPHFEKMLYDNALLISTLADVFQLTGNEQYATVIRDTIAFMEREMMSNENGFYSALDADSEGVEGKFYTWSKQEIDSLLGKDADLFNAYYNVSETGNWEHTNILRVLKTLPEFAKKYQLEEVELKSTFGRCREKLLQHRSTRIRPMLDDKCLLGWNALMNTACSKAYAALGDDRYKNIAISNMQFLESKFSGQDGFWFHTYKNDKATVPAFVDDYAYLIQAYIHLQEITGNSDYLLKARKMVEHVIEYFSEEKTGFFFYTHRNQQDVIVRKKEVYDGAAPSGNAVMAHNLLYLSIIFDRPDWNERSRTIAGALGKTIVRYPGSFGVWAQLVQLVTKGLLEIAVVGQQSGDFLRPVLKRFMPNKIIQSGETSSTVFPLLNGKNAGQNGETAFYLCKDYTCREPFFEVESLLAIV